MHAFLLAVMLVAGTARSAVLQNPDRQAVIDVINAYHDGFTSGNTAKVLQSLGPTFFIADDRSVVTPDRVTAHLFLSGEKLRAWPVNYLSQVGPHRSSSTVLSVSIRGDAAVVVTRDSGSNAFRPWTDEEMVWFVGRDAGGTWRIAGHVIRDFQMPKAP